MDLVTGMTAARLLRDGVSAYFNLKTEAERLSQQVELLTRVNDITLAMAALAEEKDDLQRAKRAAEKQAAELQEALREQSQYALTEVPSGALLYLYQPGGDAQQPAHYLCPRCWDVSKKKSILQASAPDSKARSCYECKGVYWIEPKPPFKAAGFSGPSEW